MSEDTSSWQWPIERILFANHPEPSPEELQHLGQLLARHGRMKTANWYAEACHSFARFLNPLNTVLDYMKFPRPPGRYVIAGHILAEMEEAGTSYWNWSCEHWCTVFLKKPRLYSESALTSCRSYLVGFAYLMCDFRQVRCLNGHLSYYQFAQRIFGEDPLNQQIQMVVDALVARGYSPKVMERGSFLNSVDHRFG